MNNITKSTPKKTGTFCVVFEPSETLARKTVAIRHRRPNEQAAWKRIVDQTVAAFFGRIDRNQAHPGRQSYCRNLSAAAHFPQRACAERSIKRREGDDNFFLKKSVLSGFAQPRAFLRS